MKKTGLKRSEPAEGGCFVIASAIGAVIVGIVILIAILTVCGIKIPFLK